MIGIKELLDRPVSELESGGPALTVRPQTPLSEVLPLLRESPVGAVVITEQEKVAGIVTERDFIAKVVGTGLNFDSEPIVNHMTHSPYSVTPQDPIRSVLLRMHMGGFRHMLVVEHEGQLVDIVTIKEIASYLLGAYQQA